ncbi:uncharacterized protein LOC144661046 [Oculina patagonica]
MSFIKISDPKRRDEIIQEYLRTKRSIQKQSFDKILEDKNIYTQQEKLFKPIIDAQKDEGEKLQKELQKVTSSLEPLKMLPTPTPTPAVPLPIDVPELDVTKLGDIATKALSVSLSKNAKKEYDNVTGINIGGDGKFYLGDSEVNIEGNDLIINDKRYTGTPGLWSLLTSKKPELNVTYDKDDLEPYSEIMQSTNAIRSETKPNAPKLNTGDKWKNILRDIWNEQKNKKGKKAKSKQPMTSTPKPKGKGVEFLPSDPKQLLELLRVSYASNQAGNNGERNRIVSILETLLRMGVITKNDYKTMATSIKD